MTCPEEIKQMWEIVKESFREKMSGAAFDLWYKDLTPSEYVADSNELIFDTESEFKCKKLSEQHKAPIEHAFIEQAGLDLTVSFRLVGKQAQPDEGNAILRKIQSSTNRPTPTVVGESNQLSKYTFDNFIVGGSNRFAHAVCRKVASNPFNEYNPLFIYGPSGVGKTHLMYAVINEIRRQNPNIRVTYTKGENFINDMVSHLMHGTMASFRETYRSCDVLLVDDIQFIAGKESTQEEVFHTFQALFDEGKQIILASDRPPKDINPLEERLRSRFEQGLLADIGLPDLELRLAIIKRKAEDVEVEIPTEVLSFLAENLRSNIRQIEGAIKKLAANCLVYGRSITLELARNVLQDIVGDAEPLEVTVDKIFAAVSKKYGISREEIEGQKRSKEIMEARHVAVYLIREITELSLPRIGIIFDGRDHSTIKSSYDKVQKKIVNNPLYAADIEALRHEITGN